MSEITVGDIVSVNINNGMMTVSHEAIVIHVPVATGDSWRFEDVQSRDIIYVSEGCTVIKKHD